MRIPMSSLLSHGFLFFPSQTLAFAMALPLAIGLLLLLGWHIQLTLSNKTTIEHQEVRPGDGMLALSVFSGFRRGGTDT